MAADSPASRISTSSTTTHEKNEKKDVWTSNTAFLFAAIGAAIGLGNVVRFPFLAYRHGGAAFLIPYILAWLLVGVPLLGLEYMVGQRMRQSGAPATMAMIHAQSWGIGFLACYTSFLILMTYNMIMSYTWVYLAYSFQAVLPWGTDLDTSQDFFGNAVQGSSVGNYTSCGIGKEGDGSCGVGSMQWELVVGLLVQYVLLFFALSKGKKLIWKIVMVTMPLPLILMLIIFCYALTLSGIGQGIDAYIGRIDFTQLQNGETWVDAVAQIFYGLGLASGGMLAYGAAQPSDAKVVSNTWIVTIANSLFSLLSGFTMFMIIGNLAQEQGVTVNSYEDKIGGYSLAFVTFPVAVNLMDFGVAQFMVVLFFVMLLLLGFDSAMNLIESVLAALHDRSEWFAENNSATVGGICTAAFLLGLLMCSQGGSVVVDILDHFSATYCLLVVGLLECLVVGWTYDLMPECIDTAAATAADGTTQELPINTSLGMSPDEQLEMGEQKQQQQQRFKVPPLLDPQLSVWERVQAGVFSSRLQREIALATGQDPNYLPFMWSVMIKFVTPGIIFTLLCINIRKDTYGNYGGYASWANGFFGWALCVVVPLGMLLIGLVFPDNRGAPSLSPIENRAEQTHKSRTPRPDADSQVEIGIPGVGSV